MSVTTTQQGQLITFEGGDGVGKSTQLKLAAEWLRGHGISVLETRQPGATPLGQQLRSLLLSGEYVPAPECELLLFLADRAQHVREVILPALEQGQWVLCDRYSDSTMAYQLAARKLASNQNPIDLPAMLAFAEIGCQPGRTFWLHASTEVAASRMRAREAQGEKATRLDNEAEAFHQRVHQAFEEIHQANLHRVQKISADVSIEEVHQQIISQLEALL